MVPGLPPVQRGAVILTVGDAELTVPAFPDIPARRVLVTGATGFVARTLVPLLRRRSHHVRCAVRRPVPGADTVVIGDIGGTVDWARALDGIDTVIHLAARVHVMTETEADPLAAFRRVNVEGTRRLAAAAVAAGVERFVHLSSVKAMAEHSGDAPLDDSTPPVPATPYGRSKLEAEAALAGIAAGSAMTAVTIRPPLVYGPGVGGNFRTLMDLCWRRLPLPLAAVRNRRSLLFAGNLADAIIRAATGRTAVAGSFLLHDGDPVSTPALIRAIGTALGRRGALLHVPVPVLRLAAAAAGRSDAVDRLTDSLAVDDRGFRTAFDWRPPFSMDEGMAATASWYRTEIAGVAR